MDAPVMLYACEPSAGKLLELLKGLFPDQEIAPENPDDDWEIEIEAATTGRLFRRSLLLSFHHHPDHYQGEEWPPQRDGMINYFSQGDPPADRIARVAGLIRSIRFAISIQARPAFGQDDARHELISKLARELDGFLFLPGALLDPDYHSLLEADGEFSPEAAFPRNMIEPEAAEEPASNELEDKDGEEIDPPTAERVAKRMLTLMAVAARSIAEMHYREHEKVREMHERIPDWIEELGIADEFEPAEMAAIETPLGELTERQCIDGVWRTEGIGVLAWALGLHQLSRYDQGTVTDQVLKELGFLDVEQGESILANARLRPPEDLQAMGEQQLAFHWRMRDFGLRPEPCNYRDWGETCWFGPTDLSWAEFGEDNDLALDGISISKAAPDAVSMASSTAMERHLAANWLRGYGFSETYSEVDTST